MTRLMTLIRTGSKDSLQHNAVVLLVILLLALILNPPVTQAGPLIIRIDKKPGSLQGTTQGTPEKPMKPIGSLIPKSLTRSEIVGIVTDTAKKHGLDPNFVLAVAKVESNFDPRAVSSQGAAGLMQLVPSTAKRFDVSDPFDPRQNVEAGVRYLRILLDLFKGDYTLTLAAYHCGESRILREGRVPDILSTKKFIERTMFHYRNFNGGKDLTGRKIRTTTDTKGVFHSSNAGK